MITSDKVEEIILDMIQTEPVNADIDGIQEAAEVIANKAKIEHPLTEEQCKKLGGHYWNHHSANDVVNDFGVAASPQLRHLVHYPDGEPQYRTCGLCGKTEKKIDEWADQ